MGIQKDELVAELFALMTNDRAIWRITSMDIFAYSILLLCVNKPKRKKKFHMD
jgi:hypothetical protein